MDSALFAPFAELFQLDFALDKLLILARPIIDALAILAGQFDESVL